MTTLYGMKLDDVQALINELGIKDLKLLIKDRKIKRIIGELDDILFHVPLTHTSRTTIVNLISTAIVEGKL